MEKGTEDTSKLVQIEELKCAIEKLPFVTVLSPVRAVKGKGRGYGVTLRCPSCEECGSCGKKQEPPVQVSSVHPTELACLQELLKRLQDRHVNCADAVAKKAAADAEAVPKKLLPMDVPGCLRSKLTVWKEDQFTVLPGQGIKNREARVAEWVAKALPLVKPGVWGCVQAR